MGSGATDSGDAPQNAQGIAQRMASRRVQKTAEKQKAFVTSGDNIVRSSDGSGVIAGRRGAAIVEQARQEEVDRLYTTPQAKVDAAIRQLEARKGQTMPGALGVIARMNLDRQIAQLRSGEARPEFSFSQSGNIIATGVRAGAEGQNIASILPQTQRPDVTPEVTPEVVPDDATEADLILGGAGRGVRGTKGTRYGKRFGQATGDAQGLLG